MTFSPAESLQGQSQAWHGRHPMPPAASPRCHQCWDRSLVTMVKRDRLQLPTWEITQPCTQFKGPRPLHTPVKPSLDIGTHKGRKRRGRSKLSG